MKAAIEEAGIECKIIVGVDGLRWGKQGQVLDAQGIPLRWVWKTWAWETALDQIRSENERDENPQTIGTLSGASHSRRRPRLVDVLLNDHVLVFEPLWTVISSNKALLPVLWQLYPDNPYLLNSQFSLTDELKKSGYVVKPIVGRCGSNIHIYGPNQELLNQTGGQFNEQKQIYQEYFPLPRIAGNNVQMGTFLVSWVFAGASLRADPTSIVISDSDIPALRIVNDEEFL